MINTTSTPSFISDKDMTKMEKAGTAVTVKPPIISDEEMAHLESQDPNTASKLKAPDGFLKSLAKGAIRTFAEPALAAYNIGSSVSHLVKGDVEGANEALTKSRSIPGGTIGDFMEGEKIKPALSDNKTLGEGVKEIVGRGVDIGSWFIGEKAAAEVGKQTLKGAVKQSLKSAVKTFPIAGGLGMGGRELQKPESTLGSVALNTGMGAVAGLATVPLAVAGPLVAKGVKSLIEPIESKVGTALRDAIEKGIKPYFKSTKTPAIREQYYADAENAFKTIKKYKPEITSAEDGIAEVRNPENRAEMLEGLGKAKKEIYKTYHQIAVDAGEQGAKYNPKATLDNLDKIAVDKKYNPEVRKYAEQVKAEVEELAGEAPEVIEARIQDLNASLAGYYDGRVTKAKAQIDASVANLMRKELDSLIENTTGAEYQALKNEYKSLKTIEDDLARQVAVEARKNPRGLADMTDIFTGSDLITGAITANPVQFAKGAAGFGMKELFKWINNPNRYIKNAFEILDKEASLPAGSSVATRAIDSVKGKATPPPNLNNPAVGQTASQEIENKIFNLANKKLISNKVEKVNIGPVEQKVIDTVKNATGMDIKGYKHDVDNYGLHHALKKHGNDSMPLKKEDFKLIPDIIKNYDKIIYEGKTQKGLGLDAFKYIKRYNGTTYVIEEVRTGSKTLSFKTMYKTKTPSTASLTPKN